MENTVISYYNIHKLYCGFKEKTLMENKKWSIKVNNYNNVHALINSNVENHYLNNMVKRIVDSYKYKKINRILSMIRNKCKNNNIILTYSITINCSYRIFISNSERVLEEKDVLEVAVKFYREKTCLLSDGYSSFFDGFDYDYLLRKLIDDCDSAVAFYNAETIRYIPNNIAYHFSALSAAIVNHELFGHYFESDSIKTFEWSDSIILPGRVNIYDSPTAELGGYCIFDDFGVHLEKTDIVKNGEVLGSAHIDNRRAGKKLILPRMTNTIIRAIGKKSDCNLSEVIEIQDVYRAKLSKNKVVVLIGAGYYRKEKKIFRLPFFKIEGSAVQFLKGICAFGEAECFLSSEYCIKKGECCGGIGIVSPDMYIML